MMRPVTRAFSTKDREKNDTKNEKYNPADAAWDLDVGKVRDFTEIT